MSSPPERPRGPYEHGYRDGLLAASIIVGHLANRLSELRPSANRSLIIAAFREAEDLLQASARKYWGSFG